MGPFGRMLRGQPCVWLGAVHGMAAVVKEFHGAMVRMLFPGERPLTSPHGATALIPFNRPDIRPNTSLPCADSFIAAGGVVESWSRLSEQIFRIGKWSLCRG
jgi:hypothetical protein